MNTRNLLTHWFPGGHSALGSPRTPRFAAIGLAAILGWQLAGTAWLLLPEPEAAEPAPATVAAADIDAQATDEEGATQRLARLQLFGEAARERDDGPDDGLAEAPEDAPETQLDLELRGLYAIADGQGLAIVVTGRDGEEVVGVGDTLPGNAEVAGIYGDRVLLRRDGELEALWLDDPDDRHGGGSATQRSTPADGDAERTARQLRAELTEDPGALVRMVRFQPHQEGGELVGFRLQPRGDHTETLRTLGLNPDDVLTEINGIPLNDTRRGREALEELRSAERVQVEFLRDGRREQITLNLGTSG